MSEGLGAQLDPEFRLMEFAEPYFRRFYLQSRSLGKQVKRIVEGMQEITELGLDFPGHARRMVSQLERGEITFTARLDGLEGALRELRQSANRVSVSILTASLVIGLGLLMLHISPARMGEARGLGLRISVCGCCTLQPGAAVEDQTIRTLNVKAFGGMLFSKREVASA